MEKRTLNTFIKHPVRFDFGDYILFQEYIKQEGKVYKISKPILAIYTGYFVADQTIGFDYIKWNNQNKPTKITNEHIINYYSNQRVESIYEHIEWFDFIDILGHWKYKPNWKEILSAYRKLNANNIINNDNINWDNM